MSPQTRRRAGGCCRDGTSSRAAACHRAGARHGAPRPPWQQDRYGGERRTTAAAPIGRFGRCCPSALLRSSNLCRSRQRSPRLARPARQGSVYGTGCGTAFPLGPLRQPSVTGQLCGRANRLGSPLIRAGAAAASNRCRRGHVASLWGDRAFAIRITRGPSNTCCVGVTVSGCGPPSSCSPSRLRC